LCSLAQIAGGESLDRQKAFTNRLCQGIPGKLRHQTASRRSGYDLIKIIAAAVKSIEPPYTREKIRDALARLAI